MKNILAKIIEALADAAPCSGVDVVKLNEARDLLAALEPAPVVTVLAETPLTE